MNTIKVFFENIIIGQQRPKLSIYNRFNKTPIEHHTCIDGVQHITSSLILSPADSIIIRLTDREHVHDSNVQTMIQIKEIYIDDINLQHVFLQGTFYPDYDYNFFMEHKPNISFKPGTQMYTNGLFELQIVQPIAKFLVDSYEQRS